MISHNLDSFSLSLDLLPEDDGLPVLPPALLLVLGDGVHGDDVGAIVVASAEGPGMESNPL